MKKTLAFAVAGCGFLAAANANSVADPDWEQARLDVKVAVSHGSTADTYNVSAIISDLRTGKVLSEPHLVVKGGQPAKVQVGTTDSSFEFTVTVAAAGDTAVYTAAVKRDGAVVGAQSATLAVMH